MDPAIKTCEKCNTNCKECTKTSTFCILCNGNDILIDNVCYKNCGDIAIINKANN